MATNPGLFDREYDEVAQFDPDVNATGQFDAEFSETTAGSGHPDLFAAGGTFDIAGTAAGLKARRELAAGAGSYALGGTAAGLRRGYVLATSPLSLNLSAYWPCDEASGNLLDVHAGHDGTESGGTVDAAAGTVSGARDFEEGDAEYFLVADHADFDVGSGDWSMAAWVRPESSGDSYIISKQLPASPFTGFAVYRDSGNNIRAQTSDGTSNLNTATGASVQIANNTWAHVVVTRVGTDITIYVNGTASAKLGRVGSLDNSEPLYVGACFRTSGGVQTYWDGLIDELAFWKRALTQADVNLLYNGGAGLAYGDVATEGAYAVAGTAASLRAHRELLAEAGDGALTDDLVAFYPLDEASGDALDAHGGHTATETAGTIASATGPGGVGASRDFEVGHGVVLQRQHRLQHGGHRLHDLLLGANGVAERDEGYRHQVARWGQPARLRGRLQQRDGRLPIHRVQRRLVVARRHQSGRRGRPRCSLGRRLVLRRGVARLGRRHPQYSGR